MSYADKVFINMCRDIIDNGTDTRGEKVRPVWEDGTPAYTIKKFEEQQSKAVRMSFCGSGSRNRIISMIFTVISGTVGRMKTVRSERLMDIRWA